MKKRFLKSELQSLIYNLYWRNKAIRKLKKELLTAKNDLEKFLIYGNLLECKIDKIKILRKLVKYKRLYRIF